MNKQSKDGNISWADYTWNPIKGLCPVGCWYCYARKMYTSGFYSSKPPFDNWKIRLALDNFVYLDNLKLRNLKPGTKIFICSTFEMFHPVVKKEWRDLIFEIIEMNPKLIFQILTKMPENIDRPMPDNVWLGVSVTGENSNGDIYRIEDFRKVKARIKFVSFEPMFNFIDTELFFNWLIIGKLTGFGHKHNPRREWINETIHRARARRIPIFLKNNLKEIWGEELIQEFPEGKEEK